MTNIFFHEDDYCQIEILPADNLAFCLEQSEEIDKFAEEHRDGIGFSDMFIRNENPKSLREHDISVVRLNEMLKSVFPQYDEVYTGYGSSYREKCENTVAFGNDRVIIFYDEENGFVKNIWLALFIQEKVDIKAAQNLFAALSTLGEFIIADWNRNFILKINNSEKLGQYLLELYSS